MLLKLLGISHIVNKETWAEFFKEIDQTTMLFTRLTIFFGNLHRRQIPQEMLILVESRKGGYNKDWIDVWLAILCVNE